VVVAFQANARQGTRAQKDREQVRHSTKKPFKQRELVACWYDIFPLWRGGGRIFPNMPDENFQKINKKMYRAGMASIFSSGEGRLSVVDSLTVDSPKTRSWPTSSKP
jgi:large subunit ribosomal protein L4